MPPVIYISQSILSDLFQKSKKFNKLFKIFIVPNYIYTDYNMIKMTSKDKYNNYGVYNTLKREYDTRIDIKNYKNTHFENHISQKKDKRLKQVHISYKFDQEKHHLTPAISSIVKKVYQDNDKREHIYSNHINEKEIYDYCNWSEHMSRSGRKYYFNNRTEVSQWEKPQIMQDKELNSKGRKSTNFLNDIHINQDFLNNADDQKSNDPRNLLCCEKGKLDNTTLTHNPNYNRAFIQKLNNETESTNNSSKHLAKQNQFNNPPIDDGSTSPTVKINLQTAPFLSTKYDYNQSRFKSSVSNHSCGSESLGTSKEPEGDIESISSPEGDGWLSPEELTKPIHIDRTQHIVDQPKDSNYCDQKTLNICHTTTSKFGIPISLIPTLNMIDFGSYSLFRPSSLSSSYPLHDWINDLGIWNDITISYKNILGTRNANNLITLPLPLEKDLAKPPDRSCLLTLDYKPLAPLINNNDNILTITSNILNKYNSNCLTKITHDCKTLLMAANSFLSTLSKSYLYEDPYSIIHHNMVPNMPTSRFPTSLEEVFKFEATDIINKANLIYYEGVQNFLHYTKIEFDLLTHDSLLNLFQTQVYLLDEKIKGIQARSQYINELKLDKKGT
ncbi:uncharacterized protein LOC135923391 isoform X2 [Gordionus sp. m RMFG-2023]|uniref:uncharacterized protein LOC135923391 isoform X2 n=1 Tax=Gordionus sp. m RMFG-2023 TaxID=3053472 RepID=UPI0031FBCB4E